MIKSYQKKLGSLALVSLLGSCAANIDEPPALISTPEVEYKTKKVESVIKKEDDGLFYFTFKGDKHGFTTEENAKIALERLSNE